MPEGDTVYKLAGALGDAWQGRSLEHLWLRDRGSVTALAGAPVGEVAALGKHLLVVLDDDWVLHLHLGMRGRWHRYRPGAPWQRPRSTASLGIRIGGMDYVCFHAAIAELLRRIDVASHPRLARLGPDLARPPIPVDSIVARARHREPRSVAELLLDQRVACGLGNVYKSEILFLEGCHPRTPTSGLSEESIASLYRCGARLLSWNLGGWRRTTVRQLGPGRDLPPGQPRLWVYGRAGQACARCSSRIRSELLGDDARPTYWCPGCQPEHTLRRSSDRSVPELAASSGLHYKQRP